MSRIYFHGIDSQNAEVSGAERAHFGLTCSAIAWAILDGIADDWSGRPSPLREVFAPSHYVLQSNNFPLSAKIFFCGENKSLRLGDKQIEVFSLNLNTAYFMGSDPVRLAARLHGQCELYAYVEGYNREWLADIIRQGRKLKFFRDDMGWETVIELLEQNDDSPIVTSYSTCASFPNNQGETDQDAWDILSANQQWEMGMNRLRQSGKWLELIPESWNDFYFSDGIDANILVAKLSKGETDGI